MSSHMPRWWRTMAHLATQEPGQTSLRVPRQAVVAHLCLVRLQPSTSAESPLTNSAYTGTNRTPFSRNGAPHAKARCARGGRRITSAAYARDESPAHAAKSSAGRVSNPEGMDFSEDGGGGVPGSLSARGRRAYRAAIVGILALGCLFLILADSCSHAQERVIADAS